MNNWENIDNASWRYAEQDVGAILSGASDVIDKTGGLFTAKKDRNAAMGMSANSLAAQKEQTKQLELMLKNNQVSMSKPAATGSKKIWWIVAGVVALIGIGTTIYFIRK